MLFSIQIIKKMVSAPNISNNGPTFTSLFDKLIGRKRETQLESAHGKNQKILFRKCLFQMDFPLESKSENIGLQLENKCHCENRIYYLSSLCSLHCFKTSPSKGKFNIALQYFEKIHLVSQMCQCVSAKVKKDTNHNTHFKTYISAVQCAGYEPLHKV